MFDRWTDYLNESVSWDHKTGQDVENDPIYSTTSIVARKESKRRMVRDNQGENVLSETTVYCQEAVEPEDQIDGEKVISVRRFNDFDGDLVGYEVYL